MVLGCWHCGFGQWARSAACGPRCDNCDNLGASPDDNRLGWGPNAPSVRDADYRAAVPADLGPEATEADAAEYNAAVQRLAVAFGGDRTAASAWLWGEGDYLTRIESCPGPEEEES